MKNVRLVPVVLSLVLVTACIQEAKWTWTGDTPGGDVAGDGVTGDGKGEISPSDVPGLDTDVPATKDTIDTVAPLDTADTQDACTPDCVDKECGDDGCGGSCGTCGDDDPCNGNDLCEEGTCVQDSLPDCDDDNPCTGDSCVENQGCQNDPVTDKTEAACDDGNPCTENVCVQGNCANPLKDLEELVVEDCLCDEDDDCVPLEDENLCNGTLICDTDTEAEIPTCMVDEETIVTCTLPDGTAPECNASTCAPGSGECAVGPINEDGQCSDGDACTEGETCLAGACTGGADVVCDDANPCTDDACEPLSGCVNTNKAAECDDTDPCTHSDVCEAGTCAGIGYTCDDPGQCEAAAGAACNGEGTCTYETAPMDGVPCSDGDACTEDEACAGGTCTGGSAIVCDDDNVCTDDVCDPLSGCTYLGNDAATCSDGDPCTTNDHCDDGACVTMGTLDCDDANDCTDDACIEGVGCDHAPGNEGGSCDGGLGTCIDGTCCIPDCVGKDCGSDGCGGNCGGCTGCGEECLGTQCVFTACDDKQCGEDGCGGTCGTCDALETCGGGACFCTYEACDGGCCQEDEACCGGTCCATGQVCHGGVCCTPACAGKDCGDDGCGGLCGSCAFGWLCDDEGACQDMCGDVSGLQQDARWPTQGYCSTRVGRSPFLSPAEPEILWCKDIPPTNSSPAVGADGNVYIPAGISGGSIRGFSQAGESIFSMGTSQPSYAPLITNEGLIISIGDDIVEPDDELCHLHGLSAAGDILLDIPFDPPASSCLGHPYGGPAALGDDKLLFSYGYLYNFQKSGAQLWTTDFSTHQSPAIGHSGMVYVVGLDSEAGSYALYSLTSGGETNWSYLLEVVVGGWVAGIGGPSIGADNTIYVVRGGSLYAINPNGTEKWTIQPSVGNSLIHIHPPIGPDGRLYAISMSGDGSDYFLHAVSPTGVVLWTWDAPDNLRGSPAIDAAGNVLVACDDGHLYKLSSEGESLWDLSLSTPWVRNVVIGGPQLLYVAGYKFCAVGEKTP